ncbi:MAG: tail fiber domain-containing protein, partial [Ginsengibacter sp.]
MKKNILLFLLITIACPATYSQSVGIGTTAPDNSALLELKATDKGFLPPRMTAVEKALIPSPKPGLMIYQTDGTKGLYVYDGSVWVTVSGSPGTSNGWSITGNSGTLPASNFIGTTDNQPLKFRVNNLPSGEINPISGNTVFGINALIKITTGSENTAIGLSSMNANTMGYDNTAIGSASLFSNIDGRYNTAIGSATLNSNQHGDFNTALGSFSLNSNLTGNSNVALGAFSLYSNTTGYSNVAIGNNALYYNTSNSGLVAIGDSALYTNAKNATLPTEGFRNIALGSKALYANNTGSANSATGFNALTNNTSGAANSAYGTYALFSNQTGSANNAFGFDALGNSTFGSDNTATGYYALLGNTTGSQNSAFGSRATVASSNLNNATAIGANAQANCSNCMILGSVNTINGATSSTNIGIGVTNPQAKVHISPNSAGSILLGNDKNTGGYTSLEMGISSQYSGHSYLQSISASGAANGYGNIELNPAGGFVGIHTTPLTPLHIKQYKETYPVIDGGLRLERQTNTAHRDLGIDQGGDLDFSYNGVIKDYISSSNGALVTVSDGRLKKDIRVIGTVMPSIMQLQPKTYRYNDNGAEVSPSYGFIAQEVERIFPDFVSTKGSNNVKAIAYQNFSVLAIKAIQEQEVIIENQNKRISDLELKMEQVLK